MYVCFVSTGTFDAIVCGVDAEQHIDVMLQQIRRVMRPRGVYVILSHGKPSTRLGFLQVREHVASFVLIFFVMGLR
jgi:ubiquinone/menaquinone biosynthesis C-methylase UbiE